MEPVCVRHTELPHSSKLFTDFLYHFHRVAPFYGSNPSQPASYQKVATQIHFPEKRRAALVSTLRAVNGEHPLLETLARPDTFVVATGQQVGLFSGPCYTIYKALTAIKLARTLSSHGLHAVPVFWMATEDHDFAEVSRCWTFDASQKPSLLQVETDGPENLTAGAVRLENPPLNELRASLSDLPFGDEFAAIAELSYAPGRTFGEAFLDLMRRILPEDLLYLDPLHPGIRALASPLLREALLNADELHAHLTGRAKELEAAGYHAQVRFDAGASLFFFLDAGRRFPLRRRQEHYVAQDRSYSAEELAGEAGMLSPTALLRPVMQDYILPTVAYVGGPAEIAYLAQSQVLHQLLLGRMPVTVPRAGFTVLDSRAGKLFRKYQLVLADFLHGLEPLEERIAARLLPPDLVESLVTASDSVTGHLDDLRSRLESFDPTLAAALDRSRARIMHQLAKIERKAAREALRRQDRAEAEAEYLFNLVYPRKHPQERLYTILPFLARHGLDFVSRLYENIRLDCPDHIVLTVS